MKQSGYMILNVELANNGFVELEGQKVKYWKGEGLPTFIGYLTEFEQEHFSIFQELITCKAIKKI